MLNLDKFSIVGILTEVTASIKSKKNIYAEQLEMEN